MGIFLSIIKTIMILTIVIITANISLRFMKQYSSQKNKVIKIIERVPINNNSSLSIVDICGKYYLMSFTGEDNKILKELDREEVEDLIFKSELQKQDMANTFSNNFKEKFSQIKDKNLWMWNEGKK